MLQTPFKTFDHRYFYSMIDRDDPAIIPDYYAQNIENWIIRDRGELEMRDGLTARGVSPSATNLGSAVLYQASGAKYFYRVLNGAANTSKFQSSEDGTTWTDVPGGGSKATDRKWAFVQANNFLYGVNGSDTPIKLNGTTISTVAAIPNGTAIEWWKNFLWVSGVAAVPDRVYFSNANDPETWGGSDFINVNLGDQSPTVGLRGSAGLTGRLYVGKQRSVWYITGSASSNFVLNTLTYEHGVASHECMIAVNNDVWCADLEGNIRKLYRTTEDNPFSSLVSDEIQQTISGINRASIDKATAVFYNNFALFFLPYGVDTHNSICLCWDTLANNGKGGWTKFTGWRIARATVFNETQPKLFLHDSRTGNGQTYEWTGTSDNGVAITAKYETKVYNHDYPEREKRWKFAWQFAQAQGNVNARFYSSVDRYYYVQIDTISLLGTGNKQLGVDWTLGTDKLGSGGIVRDRVGFTDNGGDGDGYEMQVKLEAESSTTKIKLRGFTMHYLIKGLKN